MNLKRNARHANKGGAAGNTKAMSTLHSAVKKMSAVGSLVKPAASNANSNAGGITGQRRSIAQTDHTRDGQSLMLSGDQASGASSKPTTPNLAAAGVGGKRTASVNPVHSMASGFGATSRLAQHLGATGTLAAGSRRQTPQNGQVMIMTTAYVSPKYMLPVQYSLAVRVPVCSLYCTRFAVHRSI